MSGTSRTAGVADPYLDRQSWESVKQGTCSQRNCCSANPNAPNLHHDQVTLQRSASHTGVDRDALLTIRQNFVKARPVRRPSRIRNESRATHQYQANQPSCGRIGLGWPRGGPGGAAASPARFDRPAGRARPGGKAVGGRLWAVVRPSSATAWSAWPRGPDVRRPATVSAVNDHIEASDLHRQQLGRTRCRSRARAVRRLVWWGRARPGTLRPMTTRRDRAARAWPVPAQRRVEHPLRRAHVPQCSWFQNPTVQPNFHCRPGGNPLSVDPAPCLRPFVVDSSIRRNFCGIRTQSLNLCVPARERHATRARQTTEHWHGHMAAQREKKDIRGVIADSIHHTLSSIAMPGRVRTIRTPPEPAASTTAVVAQSLRRGGPQNGADIPPLSQVTPHR